MELMMNRMEKMRIIALVLLTLSTVFGFSSAAFASAECLDAAKALLTNEGFAVGDSALDNVVQPKDGLVVAYRAWLRVSRCEKGYIIENMDLGCCIYDIWDQGACDVPEILQTSIRPICRFSAPIVREQKYPAR